MKMQSWTKEMIRHYLIAAIWTATDDNGDPLDRTHDLEDLSLSAVKKAIRDCKAFEAKCDDFGDLEFEQIGHDFWLTRNGHGAGFWDRDLGQLGDDLSDKCKEFGETDLYIGDDGKLYLS